jgi:osmoprotectant transport system ATP-binding protein
MAEIIRLDSVSKIFGAVRAVDEVSLRVQKAQTCVLIGPSGCGKTTTLKMINRLIEPTYGRIFVRDQDAQSLDLVELRRSIGYVIQQIGLFPHMPVEQNMTVVLRLLGWDRSKQLKRAKELCELVGLPPDEFLHRYPRQLSGGQQQRVGVARALAADPDIILMDEPFGAVDPITRKQLQRELKRIQSEVRKTIVFVTHDLSVAFFLGDQLVVMQQGKVLQDGTPRDLLLSPTNAFVSNFVGESRQIRSLRFQKVEEIMVPGSIEPVGKDEPWVFADESLLEAISRLNSLSSEVSAVSRKSSVQVVDRSGRRVGELTYQRLIRVIGEALPLASEVT